MPSLRERNKQKVRQRIVKAAMTLATAHGLERVTADQISAKAEIGRATFFRYFDSKEAAIIVGFYEERLAALIDALAAAPSALGPMEAVIWTFSQLGQRTDLHLKFVRLHAKMVTASPAMRAKSYEFHARYEQAIADAIAARFDRLKRGDLRPRLLAAATLSVVQACIEHWANGHNSADPGALVMDALEHLKTGFAHKA